MFLTTYLAFLQKGSAEVSSSALLSVLIKTLKGLESNGIKLLLVIMLFVHADIKAQPVQVELNPGTTKYNFNSLISGFLDDNEKFQFYNITIFDQYHQSENHIFNGGVNHAYLYLNTSSSFGFGIGATIHQIFGIIPKTAFQYMFVKEGFFIRIGPAITYNERLGWELLFNLAYAIPVDTNHKIMAEIRSINNYARLLKHNRSLTQVKVGIPFENFMLGIESTIDQIGSERDILSNLGVFIQYQVK